MPSASNQPYVPLEHRGPPVRIAGTEPHRVGSPALVPAVKVTAKQRAQLAREVEAESQRIMDAAKAGEVRANAQKAIADAMVNAISGQVGSAPKAKRSRTAAKAGGRKRRASRSR